MVLFSNKVEGQSEGWETEIGLLDQELDCFSDISSQTPEDTALALHTCSYTASHTKSVHVKER